MRKLQLLFLAAVFVAVPALAAKQKASIKVVNQSKWEIHHLFVSPTGEDNWGPDQLRDETIGTGESFTLTNIDCDDYDIKVIDEDGDECVIENVNMCGDHSIWKITDKNLLRCEQESN
jgi:hypothetical protein